MILLVNNFLEAKFFGERDDSRESIILSVLDSVIRTCLSMARGFSVN